MLARLRQSADMRDGAIMTIAMVGAGGFDYLTNLVSGRWLPPTQFATFVAVLAILQIMLHATNVIRNVVAFYAAELLARPAGEGAAATAAIGAFFARSWRWAWRWGIVAAVLMVVASPLLTRWLQLDSGAPLLAGAYALLLLFLRPVTDGLLQGVQRFTGLAVVQFGQAVLRFLFAIVLIQLGLQAFGAVLALPLATTAMCVYAYWLLRRYRRDAGDPSTAPRISRRYSTLTLVGLLSFALLVNMDAILVKYFFTPAIAGDYSVVITLGKINLFVPVALGMVLFPKAVARQAAGRNPVPLLLLALSATLAAGTAATIVYFAFGGWITVTLFGTEYADPGLLLGIVGAATTLFSGVNIWLNYALSRKDALYIGLLAATTIMQAALIMWRHDTLFDVAWALIAGGLAANLFGFVTFRNRLRVP